MSRKTYTYIEVRNRPWNIGSTVRRIDAGLLNKAGIDVACAALEKEFNPETHQTCVLKSTTEMAEV